jgi:hypothetical protein
MKTKNKELLKEGIATGAVLLSGFLVRLAIEKGYEALSNKEAPKNPGHHGVSWGKSILWTLATSAIISVVTMAVRPYVAVGVDEVLDK